MDIGPFENVGLDILSKFSTLFNEKSECEEWFKVHVSILKIIFYIFTEGSRSFEDISSEIMEKGL
jgi:hypothetical protein